MATQVVDDKLPDAYKDTETGTAVDTSRWFTYDTWNDGRALDFGQPTARDIDYMLPRDGKARTVEQILTMPLRSAPHAIKPAKGDSGELEWVTDALTRPAEMGGMATPLDLVLGQMTAAVGYRRAYFERVWTVDDDGKARYSKIAWRPGTSCRPNRDPKTYELDGFQQWVRNSLNGAGDWVTIPAGRAFIYTHGQHRNPIDGISDLDVVWTCYQIKAKVRFLWYSFLENQALPKLVGIHDQKDDKEGKGRLARLLASLKGGGAVALNPGQSVTPLPQGDGQHFIAALQYLDQEMTASVLAGFLELTASNRQGGGRALSSDQSDMFMQSRTGVLTEMAASFTHGVIGDLVRYNFGPKAACPRLEYGPVVPEDAERAMTLLQSMFGTQAGQARVPGEFIDELTLQTAANLELDVDKVKTAIDKLVAEAPPTAVGQLNAGVTAATRLVQAAQQRGQVPTPAGTAVPSLAAVPATPAA